jgi:hypothetical protein
MSGRIFLDARELEHPVPLERGIAALRRLNDTDHFYMLHRKYPVPLIDMAQAQGFNIRTEERPEGVWHILIARHAKIDREELVDV